MFHFKKFSIDDTKAAMKIGTDSVLLGAWVTCENETRILDIGTGSGILALMMAQRNNHTPVDAVELELQAVTLAQHNIQLSPWPFQIQVFNTSIQEYAKDVAYRYSLLVCNPPFFTDSLKSPGTARNMARHNDNLPVSDLLGITSKIITKEGKAAFIIPYDACEYWKQIAAKHTLFPEKLTLVKSSPDQKPHRILVTFTHKEKLSADENEISIYKSKSVYSEEYQYLTKEFYLNF